MIPLCHSTQKHPAGAECLSPDLCSVIPLSRYRPERWKSSPSGGLLWRNPPCRPTATDQIPQSHRSVLSASRWNPRSVLTLRSFPISGGSLHQTAWFKDFRQFHNALRQIAYEQPVPSILQATGVLYPSLRIPPFSLMIFRFSSKSLRVIALPFKS